MRVAVLASGRGSNLVSLLEHIRRGHVDAKVTLVVSDRPDAGALVEARKRGVPAVLALPPAANEKNAAYDKRMLAALQHEAPDLVVLAGYMRIVGKSVLAAFPDRIVNIHPGLLPSFKGLKAVRQALAAGVGVAGCTTHLVTADLDGGPLLLQAALAVRPGDDETTLSRRILKLEHIVLPRTVQLFAERRITVKDGRARIKAGASWLERNDIDLVSGALYSEGF